MRGSVTLGGTQIDRNEIIAAMKGSPVAGSAMQ